MVPLDDCQTRRDPEGNLSPFRQAGLPPVRPNLNYEHCNRFAPFDEDGEAVPSNEPCTASGTNNPVIPESPFIQSSQPSSQQKTDEELEPLEYEDQEDDEPEELIRQKECEAPTEGQRREHIESNHSTYRGW